MNTKVQKWGNSLAVRLPKAVTDQLELREGSEVSIDKNTLQIVIKKVPVSQKKLKKADWKNFLVSTKKKTEPVSETIDTILYGKPS